MIDPKSLKYAFFQQRFSQLMIVIEYPLNLHVYAYETVYCEKPPVIDVAICFLVATQTVILAGGDLSYCLSFFRLRRLIYRPVAIKIFKIFFSVQGRNFQFRICDYRGQISPEKRNHEWFFR